MNRNANAFGPRGGSAATHPVNHDFSSLIEQPRSQWSLWTVSVTLICLAISFDHFSAFQTNLGKIIIFAVSFGLVVYYAIVNRLRVNYVTWPVTLWIILMVYSLPGVLYMKMVPTIGYGSPPTLFCAVTMGILVVSVIFLPERVIMIDPEAALKVLKCVATCFLLGSFVALVFFGYQKMLGIRIHERAFILTIPLAAAVIERRFARASLAAILMLVILVLNPRTTVLLSYLLIFAFLVNRSMNSQLKKLVFPFFAVISLVFVFNAYEILKFVNAYVKKTATSSDNSSFREEMWQVGMSHFANAPIYGSLFTHGAAYDYGHILNSEKTGEVFESTYVPLHNDYLEFLVSGGVIGGALFTVSFLGFILMSFSNINKSMRHQLKSHLKYNQILTLTLFTAMVCMLFNPIINNAQNGFFLYSVISLIVMENLHLRRLGIY